MGERMTTKKAVPVLGTFTTCQSGVKMVIEAGAMDYCEMRTAQLAALLHVISGEGHSSFDRYSDEVQDNVKWLARTLADEVVGMLPIVAIEAAQRNGREAR